MLASRKTRSKRRSVCVTIERAGDAKKVYGRRYDRSDIKRLHYGESFKIAVEKSLLVDERTNMLRAPMHLRCESGNIYSTSDHNVCVSKLDDAACLFQIVGASKDAVPANTVIKIKHVMTNRILAYNTASGTFCLQTKVKGGAQWRLITGLTKEVDTRELPKRLTRPKEILAKVREILKKQKRIPLWHS